MEKRQQWNSRAIFVFAAVGSAAGLGNAWRFPYVAAENGGGAFLIPYFIALVTAGIPLLILEFALGHKFQAGAPVALGKVKKSWEGVGWIAVSAGFVIITYYSVIMAWVFDYLWYSLSVAWKGDPSGFFYSKILQLSEGPHVIGGFSIPVLIGLVLTWIAIYWTIKDGVKSVGKVVKWTVPLPILMLGVLAVRGLTLDGAIDGINYYLNPNFSKLLDPKVWQAAYGQVFFSLSVGFGVMIAYASYLPKKSDITNNAIMTALANSGISFLAGFSVFGTLGYMAFSKGVPVAEVATAGPGLAFVAYPEAISLLPFGQVIFALVFFIMLLTLGIDSAFSIVEGVVAGVADKWQLNKKKTTIGVILVGFVGSLLFATKSGLYWLDIIDRYINNFGIVTVGLLEVILIGWVYKSKKLRDHINLTSDIKLGKWFDVLITIVTPLVLTIILGWNVVVEIMDIANGTLYENYPTWAIARAGWGMLVVVVVISWLLGKTKGATKQKSLK